MPGKSSSPRRSMVINRSGRHLAARSRVDCLAHGRHLGRRSKSPRSVDDRQDTRKIRALTDYGTRSLPVPTGSSERGQASERWSNEMAVRLAGAGHAGASFTPCRVPPRSRALRPTRQAAHLPGCAIPVRRTGVRTGPCCAPAQRRVQPSGHRPRRSMSRRRSTRSTRDGDDSSSIPVHPGTASRFRQGFRGRCRRRTHFRPCHGGW